MRRALPALVAIGLLSTACGTDATGTTSTPAFSGPPVVTQSDAPVATPSGPAPTPSRGTKVAGACRGEQLHATRVGGSNAGVYPYAVVALTNVSTGCILTGYPVLAALATQRTGLAQSVSVPLQVGHGRAASHQDPGSRPLPLVHGASASFVVGTTLRERKRWTIDTIMVTPVGAWGAAAVAVDLPASQSGVHSFTLSVTGFYPGRNGPPRLVTKKR